MHEIVIKVSLDDDGYNYVYDGHDAYMECEEFDGGFCTSTVQNALDMAVDAAKEMLRKKA